MPEINHSAKKEPIELEIINIKLSGKKINDTADQYDKEKE